MAAGLRILIQKISQGDSNIVVKTCLKPTSTSTHQYSCFLKSCFLCNKLLNPDKDVYMYRGDQGFCSVECRDRQIFIDEMKETEISTKRILESIRHRRNSGRCESSSGLLEEFRQRHSRRKDGGGAGGGEGGGGGGRAVLFSYS